MADIGLEVEMMEVLHPLDPAKKSRQPIGRLARQRRGPNASAQRSHGSGRRDDAGGPSIPYGAKFEDGWIWGMGAHDDKGGCVAAICALEAIVRSGIRLRVTY